MHWSEFQDTAERLARGATEGDWRSAISRGYYAVFHYFREFLLSHGLNIGGAGPSHFNLYSGLLHCGFTAVAPLGSRVDTLRSYRGSADYDMGLPIVQSLAQRLVQEARVLVSDFQRVLTNVPPAHIADGARRHLQAIGRLGKTP